MPRHAATGIPATLGDGLSLVASASAVETPALVDKISMKHRHELRKPRPGPKGSGGKGRSPMRSFFCSVTLILLFVALPGAAPRAEAGEPVPLFNGKDLSGWSHFLVEPDVGMKDVWSVQDGVLVCKGEPLGYLHTTAEYESYELVVEWRWAPGTEPGNSGVLLRLNGEPKAIPRSYEAQLKSGDAGDLYGFWGMKLSGDESRKREASGHELLGDMVGFAKTEGNENPPGEWNRYEIRIAGPDIVLAVNGKTLNEATGAAVLAGQIGLQSEGGEIHFRKVELTPID